MKIARSPFESLLFHTLLYAHVSLVRLRTYCCCSAQYIRSLSLIFECFHPLPKDRCGRSTSFLVTFCVCLEVPIHLCGDIATLTRPRSAFQVPSRPFMPVVYVEHLFSPLVFSLNISIFKLFGCVVVVFFFYCSLFFSNKLC